MTRSSHYRFLFSRFAVWALVLLTVVGQDAAGANRQGMLAEGTPWATPYFVQESNQPGATVMIVGGMHGDEPAGAYAAEQIRRWRIVRGKVVVVPRANVQA